jgi:hypothetical protein
MLQHPNIITVHEISRTADRYPVMELLEGAPLLAPQAGRS